MALLLWNKSSSVPLWRRFLCAPPITHSFPSHRMHAGISRSSGWRTEEEIRALFDEWTIEHERSYTGVERDRRFQIWRDTFKEVERHNNTGCPSWRKGLNQFADLTDKEFARYNNYAPGRARFYRLQRRKQLQEQQQQQRDG